MPLSEYKDSVGGGLKLKGVKDGRVKKSKKRDKKESKTAGEEERADRQVDETRIDIEGNTTETHSTEGAQNLENKYGKTDAQLRFEERRKKRLDEQAQKEGPKSHKEKVEALNNYLSKLSEHNDMPRIGPG